jgi:hypothetical protein
MRKDGGMGRWAQLMAKARGVSARAWLTAASGVVAGVGAVFLPDGLQPSTGTLFFAACAVGALLVWPRSWPGLAGGAVVGWLLVRDEPGNERLSYVVGGALLFGALDLGLRRGERPDLRGLARAAARVVDDMRRPWRGGPWSTAVRATRVVRDAIGDTFRRTGHEHAFDREELRDTLREGRELLGVVAAVLYGTAWLAAQWFYGSIGVTPGEVGLTAVDLLLASGVAAMLIAAVILAIDLTWRRVRHPVLRVPLFLGAGAAIGSLGDLSSTLLFAAIGSGVAIGTSDVVPRDRPRSRLWMLTATSVGLVALLVIAYGTAVEMRMLVKRGEPSTLSVLNIQVAALWAPTTQVWAVDGQTLPPQLPSGSCASRLGNAAGVTVFFHEGRVFRVPTENVVSRSARCSRRWSS